MTIYLIKTKKNSLLLAVLVTAILFAVQSKAELAPQSGMEYLIAEYQIEVTDAVGQKRQETLKLVRNKKQVMYSNNGVNYVWDKLINNRLKLTKYVEAVNRGIEYQPSDLSPVNEQDAWQQKFQLLSDLQLFSLKGPKHVKCESHKKCDKVLDKKIVENLQTVWLQSIKLPKEMVQFSGSEKFSWKLTKLKLSSQAVSKLFEPLNQYQLIDFADIGDAQPEAELDQLLNSDLSPLVRQAIWSLDKQAIKPIARNHHSHSH